MGTTRVAFASSHLLGVLRACKPKTRPSLIRELGSWYSIERERGGEQLLCSAAERFWVWKSLAVSYDPSLPSFASASYWLIRSRLLGLASSSVDKVSPCLKGQHSHQHKNRPWSCFFGPYSVIISQCVKFSDISGLTSSPKLWKFHKRDCQHFLKVQTSTTIFKMLYTSLARAREKCQDLNFATLLPFFTGLSGIQMRPV